MKKKSKSLVYLKESFALAESKMMDGFERSFGAYEIKGIAKKAIK